MKTPRYLFAPLLAIAFTALGQPPQPIPVQQPPPLPPQAGPGALTKFDLDFPGGKPRELVAAIRKAIDRPLNVIIPDEYADLKLPALKMKNVDVSQLFEALAMASRKTEAYISSTYSGGSGAGGYSSISTTQTGYGFRAQGKLSDDTIWYFYVEKPALPPSAQPVTNAKVCRFYALAPFLQDGATIDDITTAIQTGWKMLGDATPPAISFHKETKLLIAVGEPGKLETIDAALKALDMRTPAPPARKPVDRPKAAEKAKTEE